MRRLTLLIAWSVLSISLALAGTTGKIKGLVTDQNGEVLIGVNVLIEGTTQGAVTDINGFYQIVNVKPGTYTLVFRYIGFAEQRVTNVRVIVDKTTEISIKLSEETIEGEEIVVVAKQPIVEVDRTTTTATIGEEELNNLPILNVSEAIELQAGVNGGNFRGGRVGEVAYLVNGVSINNAFNNQQAFEVEPNQISSLEVISGVFNAEYGQALSGVVNIVTKGVQNEWSGSAYAGTGYLTSWRDVEMVERTSDAGNLLSFDDFRSRQVDYFELQEGQPNVQDYRLNIAGPIIKDKLSISLSGRYFKEEGHLFGTNLFLPSDSSSFVNQTSDQSQWILESNGDGSFVSMNGGFRVNLNPSIVWQITPKTKLDYNLFFVDGEFQFYSHDLRLRPGGRNTGFNQTQNHIVGLRHTFNATTFANLSYQYQKDKTDFYLFKNPADPRHEPAQNNVSGARAFALGGNDLGQSKQQTETHTVVGSVTSQVNRFNQVKAGFEFYQFLLDNYNFDIEVEARNNFIPQISQDPFRSDSLDVKPFQFAAYVQDKIEFESLIINIGLRFDYFDSNYRIARDLGAVDPQTNLIREQIPDPDNPGQLIDNFKDADPEFQFSPRVGLAFPISANGVLRFSYGMFFQRPALSQLFTNPNFEVSTRASTISFGNAAIEPEQSTSFEIGFQQGFSDFLGIDATLYSKDIRNLVTFRFDRDERGNQVIRLVNDDFGTVRGATISLFQRPLNGFSWNLNYTLQFAEGSASNPTDAFLRAQAGLEENRTLERLNWDRRHMANISLIYQGKSLTLSSTNQIQSGEPFTTERNFIRSFIQNNEDKPLRFISDFRASYKFGSQKNVMAILFIENLFDSGIINTVFNDTGRPDETITQRLDERAGLVPGGVNSLDAWFERPDFLSRPRRIQLGLQYNF